MKKLFPYLLLFFTNFLFAQTPTATITGFIKNDSGEALSFASVLLSPTNKSVSADKNGRFEFTQIPAGQYTIKVSFIGYQAVSESVIVSGNKLIKVQLTLPTAANSLQDIEITGRKEQSYKNSITYSGTKTATAIKDIPQSIGYVTKELMADQGAAHMTDITKNISGVNMYTFYDDITIRGFRNQGGVGSSSSTQLFNGLRTFTGFWRQPLLNYLERVEIIKGPTSALYGNANPGGTVNKVTKKPLDEERKSVSMSLGSYNTVRTLVDFTGPANKEKTLLYRLNLGYENANSFRDLQYDKDIVIAPSLSFLPDDKTRLNFDAVYNKSNSRLDRGQAIYGSNDLFSTPISTSLSEVNDYLNEEVYMVTASLVHEFSKNISFNTSYLRTGYRQDLLEHRGNNAYAVDMKGVAIPTLASRQVNLRHNERFADSFTAFFNFNFNTGPFSHKLITGYDYSESEIPQGSSQSNATGYLLKDGTVTSKYVVKDSAKYQTYVYNGKNIPKPNVTSYDLTTNSHILQDVSKYVYSASANDVTKPVKSTLNSVYAQDQIKIGKLQVLLGLRLDNYNDKINYQNAVPTSVSSHIVLPRAGAVYELTKNINAYGTYTQGYNPQDASVLSNPTVYGGPFKPVTSNLVEGGFKSDWFNSRLSVTLSAYQIIQHNTLYSAGSTTNPDLLVQVGDDKAKGIEMDVVGYIMPNLSIIANYAYNKATLSGAKGTTDTAYNNQQKPNAPKNQGSIWAKYSFTNLALRGFGLGLGASYTGNRTFGFQGTNNIIATPGPEFLLLNAAVYYKVNKMQIQVNFNNLTNKTYWVGGYDHFRLYPGSPFNWLTTLSYTF